MVQGTVGIPSISTHFTEIESECCDLRLAIPSTETIITKGFDKKLKALKANKNRLEAPVSLGAVSPKAAAEADPPKFSDREEVAKLVNPAKVPKTKDTVKQALSSPTALEAQSSLVEPITPPSNQSSAQRKEDVKPTLTKLSKAKAAGATEVTPESSTQGLNVPTPNEPGAEPRKKKKKTKKNMDGGEDLVAKGKPKKSHKKTEKESVDCKGKAKSQALPDTNLSTVTENPVAEGTKKIKKKNKVTPTKVKGIVLTTKISSKGKEAEKRNESENQPGKSTRPRTSAK